MLKLLWKLKGLFAFIACIGVVVVVMAILINKSKKSDAALVAPTVSAENVIVDKEPNNTSKKKQKTKRSLGLDDWMQVDGMFESVDDSDRYAFGVADGVNGYEIQTWKDVSGELAPHTGMLGMNAFPITLTGHSKADRAS